MTLSDQAFDALLKRLHLANTRRAWRELARRVEQEEWTYHDFLTLLISEEIAHRQQTRLDRLVRRARFPFSRRSMISTLRTSRSSGSRSWAQPSRRIS